MATLINAGYGDGSSYWRTSLRDSEGDIVMGSGLTEKQSDEDAAKNLADKEAFLSKPPLEQLDIIASQKYILSTDTTRAIKLINKILQGQKEPETIEVEQFPQSITVFPDPVCEREYSRNDPESYRRRHAD